MIEEWLQIMIPNEQEQLIKLHEGDRLRLLVTPVPSFGKRIVSEFQDKDDLIRCNMASIHLPLFLDGHLTANFRGHPMIDGSFPSHLAGYSLLGDPSTRSLHVDSGRDPTVTSTSRPLTFVQALSPSGIWGLFEQGK